MAAAATWATSVILFKQSEAAKPQAMNLFKNLLALVCLLLTLPFVGPTFDYTAGEWLLLAVSGVIGIAIADTMIFEALRRLGAALLSVVDLIYAPVLVLLSVLFLDERLSGAFIIGAALVVLGLIIVTVPRGERASAANRDLLGGVLIGATGIVVMGIGVIVAKPILDNSPLVEVVTIRLVFGVVGQLAWIAFVPGQRAALAILKPSPVWKTLVPASFLGSYVAMLFWLGGFKYADASVAAILNQMSAVFTIVLAWLILGDKLDARRAVGAAVAFIGAVVVLVYN